MTLLRNSGRGRAAHPPRGVATLVVVMVLFFVVAMVAAYTSRNLIFEQKTSANQYRSTIAFEAAEAGVEWTLAMLNGGVVDGNCASTTALPGSSFQQRYLSITADADLPTNGRIANPAARPTGSADNWPACSLDGDAWGSATACRCPDNGQAAPASVERPAFRVWIAEPSQLASRAGLVNLQVNGCTRMPAGNGDCLDFDPQGASGDALAAMRVVVALRSAIASVPAAAVTVQGGLAVDPAAATVQVVNTEPAVNGVTVHTGSAAALPTGITALGVAGAPGAATWFTGDSRLAEFATLPPGADPVADNRMFIAQFGMKLATYRDQPGARSCPGYGVTVCNAANLQTLLDTNPHRVLWVEGDVTLNATLGSRLEPVLLVVNNGTLTLGPAVEVFGLVYLVGVGPTAPLQATLVAPSGGPATITGALVAGGNLQINHSGGAPGAGNGLTVSYDRAVLNLLRTTYGSWVRLPGGWRDFKD